MYYYIAVGLIALLGLWALGSYLVVRSLEEPSYTVLETYDEFEIRQYDSYIVAEATVTTEEYRDGINTGFQLVADYIFGNNTTQEKISMTTPVIEEPKTGTAIAMTVPVLEETAENNERIISFVLPSEYTLETLPLPNNDRVTLREVPAFKAAVLRFGWYGTPTRVASKKEELVAALTKEKVRMISEPKAAFYNPPLSMPATLRNEIIVTIE